MPSNEPHTGSFAHCRLKPCNAVLTSELRPVSVPNGWAFLSLSPGSVYLSTAVREQVPSLSPSGLGCVPFYIFCSLWYCYRGAPRAAGGGGGAAGGGGGGGRRTE